MVRHGVVLCHRTHRLIGACDLFWALTIRLRPIIGTLIAYGVAAAAQLVTIPTIATEIRPRIEVQKALAYEVEEDVQMLSQGSTEAVVRKYFEDIPILAEIAWCESGFTQVMPNSGEVMRGAQNPNDIGVMQINLRYHADEAQAMGLDLFTLKGNMAYARTLYEREGTRPWNASRGCWQPRLLAMQ